MGEKMKEKSVSDLWDSIKYTYMYILRNPRRRGEKMAERISEEMKAKIFPVLIKKMMLIKLQV